MAYEATELTSNDDLPPLLLHFDVNKTLILADSVQSATVEDGVRESLAELFWGRVWSEGDELLWEWTKHAPSCLPPDAADITNKTELITYSVYCKRKISDKKTRKKAVRDLSLVGDAETREAMDKMAQTALKSMELSEPLRQTEAALSVGLSGSMLMMFPAFFSLVAKLQRARRTFAILFRTFGVDHEIVTREWNAFCEMRHPVFSNLLEDIGPLDGSKPGVPDRRYFKGHTLYRDAEGPVLGLDVCTNGPEECTWDSWAKQKPKPEKDTRGGRDFFSQLTACTVDGYAALEKWTKEFCKAQSTATIKDDWAWWNYHGETATAGKLMLLQDGVQQIFFDDNVEHDEAHIVDCRMSDGTPVPFEESINKFMTKVNPVEAVLDETYFSEQLRRCTDRAGIGSQHAIKEAQQPPEVQVSAASEAMSKEAEQAPKDAMKAAEQPPEVQVSAVSEAVSKEAEQAPKEAIKEAEQPPEVQVSAASEAVNKEAEQAPKDAIKAAEQPPELQVSAVSEAVSKEAEQAPKDAIKASEQPPEVQISAVSEAVSKEAEQAPKDAIKAAEQPPEVQVSAAAEAVSKEAEQAPKDAIKAAEQPPEVQVSAASEAVSKKAEQAPKDAIKEVEQPPEVQVSVASEAVSREAEKAPKDAIKASEQPPEVQLSVASEVVSKEAEQAPEDAIKEVEQPPEVQISVASKAVSKEARRSQEVQAFEIENPQAQGDTLTTPLNPSSRPDNPTHQCWYLLVPLLCCFLAMLIWNRLF